jgi:hypothetical protein
MKSAHEGRILVQAGDLVGKPGKCVVGLPDRGGQAEVARDLVGFGEAID